MSKLASFPGGMLLGAGLMYFLDPVRGRKRRARINDAVQHAERVERELFARAARDARHRVESFTERVKHRPSADATDEVIVERVRARIGRAVSHPRALDISCIAGRLILRGAILEREAAAAIWAARGVPGVRDVVDRLERHADATGISSLQGPGRERHVHGWSPALQATAAGAGALLVAYGTLLRRGVVGGLLSGAGAALVMRGVLNKPLPDLVGIGAERGGVTVQKTITVDRPIHVVFDLWSRLDNFPQFMRHVREVDVEIGGRKTRWVVDGPAGTKVEFQAETTELEPDRVIAWSTLPGQSVEHEGRVRFEETDRGTRVHVHMTYRPPGGVVGHTIAHLLGWDPKARMDDDLVRMKALLEDGMTRANEGRIAMSDLH